MDQDERDFTIRRLDIDERNLQALEKFQAEQIDLQRDKIALERKAAEKSSLASNPVLATLSVAVSGLAGTIWATLLQGQANRDLEREKLRSNVILKAIETGNPLDAAKNLEFFASLQLIDLPASQRQKLQSNPAGAPVLPFALPESAGVARNIVLIQEGHEPMRGNVAKCQQFLTEAAAFLKAEGRPEWQAVQLDSTKGDPNQLADAVNNAVAILEKVLQKRD